jgi:hypothetical protein
MDMQCAKCRSPKVIPMVGIKDQGNNSDGSLTTQAVGYTNPDAWIFKGPIATRLHATICGECGYTELTAENPAALYEAFMKATSKPPA